MYDNCRLKMKNKIKEEESSEILIIFDLINNTEDHKKIFNHV